MAYVNYGSGSRGYLLVTDSEMINKVRLAGLLGSNPFEKISAVTKYLVLPNLDCVLLEASSSTQKLANEIRQHFGGRVFLLTRINEADGFLPQAAWEFINATRLAP